MMNEREQGQFILDENCVVSKILEEISDGDPDP